MSALSTRLRVELRDALAYGVAGKMLRAAVARLAYLLAPSPIEKTIRRAALIRVLGPGNARQRALRELSQQITSDPAHIVTAHRHRGGPGRDGAFATRTTVLKAPSANGERGVIYTAFEYNWIRLLEKVGDLNALMRDYDVIWATSWSPTDYLDVARVLAASSPEFPVYVQASNFSEFAELAALHPRVRVVPNLLCEYLDPASFSELPANQRDIDLLVVSNWAPFKRHFELFRALRAMPSSLRIVCIGQPERGSTRDGIVALASAYGVPQQIEFLESLPLADVRALQARSKAAAIFSRREGSCVAATEALFAGASLGLMSGAQVGSTAYVNAETGVLLDGDNVARDLTQLIAGAGTRSPRKWALANIGRDRASHALNAWLRERAIERGLPWTRDIAAMSWSPYPWIGNPVDRAELVPAVEGLASEFPGVFRADLLDESRF